MKGFGGFDNSTSKEILNKLETVYLNCETGLILVEKLMLKTPVNTYVLLTFQLALFRV